jgi:hypothetical protein
MGIKVLRLGTQAKMKNFIFDRIFNITGSCAPSQQEKHENEPKRVADYPFRESPWKRMIDNMKSVEAHALGKQKHGRIIQFLMVCL